MSAAARSLSGSWSFLAHSGSFQEEEMASDRASPLQVPDEGMIAKAARSPFASLSFPLPAPGTPGQPAQEPPTQCPVPPAFSPAHPLMLSAFPRPLLVTGDGDPGPSGMGALQIIVKVKTEAGSTESFQAQNFVVTQPAFSWMDSGAACGAQEGPAPQYVTASPVNTILPTSSMVSVSHEGPSGLLPQAPPPAAQLASIVSPGKAWPGPQGAIREAGAVATGQSSLGELTYASKGVYENFRRWQCYKPLARRYLPQGPDTEALSCFLIPVLRSLGRRKPTMTLEEGLPRAVQEWDRTSNYDRMVFYEMAEKFMEFEAEELQIQNTQLMSNSQGPTPAALSKADLSGALAPDVCQQPVYILKKSVPKTRAPRQRQRKPQRPPVLQTPKEIPPEAVEEYINIMEGLVGSHPATRESDGEEKQQSEEMYPDPSLQSYMEELCSQEPFVSKVEAVIHPQFLADLLSPERERDPLTLTEELEQEEGLTFTQLIQKRLSALEEEVAEVPPGCSGAQLNLSPVSEEDENGGGWSQPPSGPQEAEGTIGLEKPPSSGKQATEIHSRPGQALEGPTGTCRDGHVLSSCSSWDLQEELVVLQEAQTPLGMEGRGPGEGVGKLSQYQDSLLECARSPGHCLVADSTAEALPLYWQESPQPSLDAELAGPDPLQSLELEKPDPGWQIGQEAENFGMFSHSTEPLVVSQKGSAGAMWGVETSPPRVQSYDQSLSFGTAGDRDRASFSPGLWLSNETDTVSLALPLEIEEVIESFQDGTFLTEHQALGSTNTFSLGPGETTVSGNLGASVVPCGSTEVPAALSKRNYCSLDRPLSQANSPALGCPKDRKHFPEGMQDPSNPWGEGCSLLMESSVDACLSTFGSSKETTLPLSQSSLLVLGAQHDPLPVASQDTGSTGNPFSFLLETAEQGNLLDVRDEHGLQSGFREEAYPPVLHTHGPQEEDRRDTGLFKPHHLGLFQGNQEPYTQGAPKSAFPYQGLGNTSRWRTKEASVLRESSRRSKTHNSADGANRGQKAKEDREDEQLSNFTYLLASKLSLSPRRLPLGPHCASGGGGSQRAPHTSDEARGLGQPAHSVTRSEKQALAGGSTPVEKTSQAGPVGEKSVAQGVIQSSQPHKRRCESSRTSRRKKHRHSQ